MGPNEPTICDSPGSHGGRVLSGEVEESMSGQVTRKFFYFLEFFQ